MYLISYKNQLFLIECSLINVSLLDFYKYQYCVSDREFFLTFAQKSRIDQMIF